jgi:hypothetical protein
MQTYSLLLVLFSLSAFANNASASPGDLPEHVPSAPGEAPGGASVVAASSTRGPTGALVFGAGPGTTRAASAHVASMGSSPGLLSVTHFVRTTDTQAPWVLDADGHLKAEARPGSAEVVVFDLSNDPHAVENHTAMSIFPIELPAGANAITRLVLSPNDGYAAGRTYDVQIVQRLSGAHRVVGRGTIVLE